MHKSLYKFFKKRNKCVVKIKSIIRKSTINGGKNGWNNKRIHQKRNKIGERERERERVLTFVAMNNLEGIGERGGNEVKRNL